ncbi:protein FAM24A-like [Prionailurus bengalensis]|uniref:protein FAM24A-like n=1 Tax=Prionailurus bengalensis TaxID=37029 RepID=UPI001CA840B9|nr:protein FAM24A-like [Prionailurus bengalensis]
MRAPASFSNAVPSLPGKSSRTEHALRRPLGLRKELCAGAGRDWRERRPVFRRWSEEVAGGVDDGCLAAREGWSFEESPSSDKSTKVNTIIMFSIAGGILVAMLVLMAVVICLYYKVANALKCSKAPLCLALKNSPLDKVAAAAITAGSYPNLQCCDECSLYADFDSLPPCFCDVNEGL